MAQTGTVPGPVGPEPIGKRRWAIAEGYIPAGSTGTSRELRSHETACILNAGPSDAHLSITIFYADRGPEGPHRVVVPVVVQHTRLDSRLGQLALLSTVAYASD